MSSGHYVCYEPRKFREKSLRTIEVINKIIVDYEKQGFSLTVRQIFYQLVQDNYIRNTKHTYDHVKGLVSTGRLAGLISWHAIEDRTRNLQGNRHWLTPAEACHGLATEYKIDKWHDQEWRPEVWNEKQALEGIIGQIATKLDVDFFTCRGYNSQSEQWSAGRRFARYLSRGQRPIVFYFGDRDPSGENMTDDIRRRLEMFCGVPVIVQRLALNISQIEELKLPPNYAKDTDSRYKDYVKRFGTENSWELDALKPQFIQDLIEDAVTKIRDPVKWDAALEEEVDHRRVLEETAELLGWKDAVEDNDDDQR